MNIPINYFLYAKQKIFTILDRKMVCLYLNWSKSKFRADGLYSSTLPLVSNLINVVFSPK